MSGSWKIRGRTRITTGKPRTVFMCCVNLGPTAIGKKKPRCRCHRDCNCKCAPCKK